MAEGIPQNEEAHQKARNWIIERLPVFMYLEDYPEINGHQDIAKFNKRKTDGQQTPADINFEKLCKVAGLSPQHLQELLQNNDQETRGQLANRAGAVVTSAIRKRWKDRELKVRFNLDAQHFDTLISAIIYLTQHPSGEHKGSNEGAPDDDRAYRSDLQRCE